MTDYTSEAFVISIEADDARGYASIHAEMYRDEDGLDITGNYFVYLLHPTMGSTYFTMEPDNSYKGWARIGGAIWLNDELEQTIIDAIEARKKFIHA